MPPLLPCHARGVTAVLGFASDAIFRAPVYAWYVEDYDTADSPVVCAPMIPDECGQLVVARAPVVGLEWPGCEPSDWTARITRWEREQEERRRAHPPRFDPFAPKPQAAP